jgi:hypothetical protein
MKKTRGQKSRVRVPLRSLGLAFQKFRASYNCKNNNYLKAVLYGDTTLTVSPRSKDFLNVSDLDLVQSLAVREHLTKIKICDMLQNGLIKDRPSVENLCGGPVPGLVYDKLKKIVNNAKVKLHRDIETKGIDLTTFLHGWKRGSKKFRNILSSNVEYVPHNLVKYASNMETVINLDCAKLLSRDWTYSFYSNQLRTFIFKLHNNTLPYNTVLSHFVRGNTRNCTFCNIAENPDPEDETPFHLFFDCAATERIRIDFLKWVTNNENFSISRHDFFCCGPKQNSFQMRTSKGRKIGLRYFFGIALVKYCKNPYRLTNIYLKYLAMEVDPDGLSTVGSSVPSAAAASAAAARSFLREHECRELRNLHPPPPAALPGTNNKQVNDSNASFGLINQCSNAKKLSRTIEVLECTGTGNGPQFIASTASIPRVGDMFETGKDYNLFHRARMVKVNVQTNEVISCSFDPATLNCVVCPKSHPILSKTEPVAICFADQNFVTSLSGTGCIVCVRYEDATLSELAVLALEILDKNNLHPGSVLLFGSMSHLFKVGASCYAADWISLLMKIETRYKNLNVCPLVPVPKSDFPGSVVRDIEIFSTWLHKVYANNIKGLLDTWTAVTHYAQNSAMGFATLPMPEVQKVPLPANLVTPQLQPATSSSTTWYRLHLPV